MGRTEEKEGTRRQRVYVKLNRRGRERETKEEIYGRSEGRHTGGVCDGHRHRNLSEDAVDLTVAISS